MAVLNSRAHQWGRNDAPLTGLFVSTDGASTWQHRGWREYVRTFYTEQGLDGTIWSACGNGVHRSTDGGKTWRVSTGWEVTEVLKVKVDPSNPMRVFAATAYGVIYSSDRGETWVDRNNGIKRKFTSDICIDRTNTSRVFVATELGIFRSENSGATWEAVGPKNMDIRTIVQHPGEPREFWAGTEDDGLLLSTDSGLTWKQMNSGLEHNTVYAIAFDREDATIVYVGTHGGGVYRSTDGGKLWERPGSGITAPDIHALITLRVPKGMVLAGTLNGGLFSSADRGITWQFNSQQDAQVWGLSN
jgi:photosystem II stability/assembly factor-like uncharacterized protein